MSGLMVTGRSDRGLERHGSARGHHRGGDQRRHVGRAGGEGARRRHHAAAEHDAGRRCRAARGGSAARSGSAGPASGGPASADPEHLRDYADGAERGGERRQLATAAAQLGLEPTAASAVRQVPADGSARSDAAVVRERELVADLDAGGVPRLDGERQADPRPDQERLHRRHRDIHGCGDVGIAHPAELSHEQRRSLLRGKPMQIGDQPLQRLTLFHSRDRVVRLRRGLVKDGRRGRRGRRNSSTQRLCATRYSHGRKVSSRRLARSPA